MLYPVKYYPAQDKLPWLTVAFLYGANSTFFNSRDAYCAVQGPLLFRAGFAQLIHARGFQDYLDRPGGWPAAHLTWFLARVAGTYMLPRELDNHYPVFVRKFRKGLRDFANGTLARFVPREPQVLPGYREPKLPTKSGKEILKRFNIDPFETLEFVNTPDSDSYEFARWMVRRLELELPAILR